jgi:hypothetical protein
MESLASEIVKRIEKYTRIAKMNKLDKNSPYVDKIESSEQGCVEKHQEKTMNEWMETLTRFIEELEPYEDIFHNL